MSEYLTLPQVAKRLQVSLRTVQRMVETKRLRATNVGLGERPRWRVRAEVLQRYLDARDSIDGTEGSNPPD